MVRTLKARTLRTARLKAYPEKDVFISRGALAERWDVHVETIKRDERNGLLQPVRIGERRIRYRLDDILQIEGEAKLAANLKAMSSGRRTAKDVLVARAGATRAKAEALTEARREAALRKKTALKRRAAEAILSTLDSETPATQGPQDKEAVTTPLPKTNSKQQQNNP